MEYSRTTKGRIAEAETMLFFIKEGYEIYLPQQECGKYDMLVVKDSLIKRVSVKYCGSQQDSGSWRVSMTNVSRRANNETKVDKFDSNKYDLIAVYIGPEDRVVVVPASDATPNILTIKEGSVSERPMEKVC